MQAWEATKKRAIETLPVWRHHAPTLTVGGQGFADLETLIDGFEPRAQARVTSQDALDAADRALRSSLQRLHLLGARIPQMLEAQRDGDEGLSRDLRDVFKVRQSGPNSILERARLLHPVWVRVNAALAATSPPQPPVTRPIEGVVHTAAIYLALIDGYTALTGALSDAKGQHGAVSQALVDHQKVCDGLIKRWYKLAKATFEPDTAARSALETIRTEKPTPRPIPIEISTLTQGGEGGLWVVVAYAPGGGKHATKRRVMWQVDGVDPGYDHEAPLEAGGNVLGPFVVGQVVRVITEVGNSVGKRTGAVRTIVIEAAMG